jgi:hypothetical protein
MEQPIFKLLELFADNSNGLFWVDASTLFHSMHFTDTEYKTAATQLQSRGYIQTLNEMEAGKGVKLQITDGGRAALEREKKNRDENTIIRRLDIEKEMAERKLINQQLKLMSIQIETANQQNVLNPLMIEANKSILVTNENIVETNKHTRQTNKILVMIFAVTAAFTLIGAIGSIGTLFKSDDKSDLVRKVTNQDSVIGSLSVSLQESRNIGRITRQCSIFQQIC